MTDFIPGTKYVRRGGGYYIFYGITEDGKLLVERQGGVFKLQPEPGFAVLSPSTAGGDMLPEPFEKPIKYSMVVYLASQPCLETHSFNLDSYLFGSGNRSWCTQPHERYPVPVRITIETIEEGG